MKNLRVAIIGCGEISDIHIKHILSYNHAKLVGVYDINIERAIRKSEVYNVPYVNSIDELISLNLDVCHVLTPHDTHYEITKLLIKHHINVLVEKPLTILYKQAIELSHLALENHVVLSVCLQHRTNRTTKKMIDLSQPKAYGKVLAISGKVHWDRDLNYYQKDLWRGTIRHEGGGVLINQAIHTLDIMNLVAGEVDEVSGTVAQFQLKDIEVEDTAHVHIKYKDGAVGFLDATNSYPKDLPIEIDVLYSKGRVKLVGHQLFDLTEGNFDLIEEDLSVSGNKFYFGAGHEKLIHNLYDHIVFKIGDYVEAVQTIETLEIIEKIYQAKPNETIKIERSYWKEDK